MGISRRDFFKISGAGVAASTLGLNLAPVEAKAEELSIRYAKETTTICPYCSVGCGMIVHTLGGNVINVEGDPDHPINEGALCPKGSSVFQLRDNKARVTKPLYRAAGASRVEGSQLGLGAGRDRQEGQEDPRHHLRGHLQDQGQGKGRRCRGGKGDRGGGQPDHGDRLGRQRRPGQRRVLPVPKIPEGVRPGVYRTSGPHLTQRNCCGSGRVVRTRCNDEPLD